MEILVVGLKLGGFQSEAPGLGTDGCITALRALLLFPHPTRSWCKQGVSHWGQGATLPWALLGSSPWHPR